MGLSFFFSSVNLDNDDALMLLLGLVLVLVLIYSGRLRLARFSSVRFSSV